MAEKKMTQVTALETAIELMNEFATLDEQVEAREILQGMVETRRKANANRKPRQNKEAEEFAAAVATFLSEQTEPLTNGEIAVALSDGAAKGENGYVSFQKVAAAIRKLEEQGAVVRHKGEKAKDKDTFTVA
jgi:hypothetical protein